MVATQIMMLILGMHSVWCKYCEVGDYKCSDRNGLYLLREIEECADQNKVCDGYVDCPFGDDEHNCPELYGSNIWRCPSDGTIIPIEWSCVNQQDTKLWDCPNQDDVDAINCVSCDTKADVANFFSCKDNGRCIPSRWICDGEADCMDRSDEAKHLCPTVIPTVSPQIVPPSQTPSMSPSPSPITTTTSTSAPPQPSLPIGSILSSPSPILPLTISIKEYYYVNEYLSWIDAEHYCYHECNSNLASFHSENDYLQLVSITEAYKDSLSQYRVWLGLTDFIEEGVYYFTDNTPFDYATELSVNIFIVYRLYDCDDDDTCIQCNRW